MLKMKFFSNKKKKMVGVSSSLKLMENADVELCAKNEIKSIDNSLVVLTSERLTESLSGWGFPYISISEEILSDWNIDEEKMENVTQFHFKENIYFKGKKVLTSTYSPYSNERRIRIWDKDRWLKLQRIIYSSHQKRINQAIR